MKFGLSPRAGGDIEDIQHFLEEQNPGGAENVLREIYRLLIFIAEQPQAGKGTQTPGVRVVTVTRYPFRIFYRLMGDTVEIIHVRHTARQEM